VTEKRMFVQNWPSAYLDQYGRPYALAHDWGWEFMINQVEGDASWLTDTALFNANIIPALDALETYGIDVWVQTEGIVNDPAFSLATTVEGYDTAMGDSYDTMDSYPNVKGYSTEIGYDTYFDFIHTVTNKEVGWWHYGGFPIDESPTRVYSDSMVNPTFTTTYFNPGNDITYRLDRVDYVICELDTDPYFGNYIPDLIRFTQFVQTNYPTIKTGILFGGAYPNMDPTADITARRVYPQLKQLREVPLVFDMFMAVDGLGALCVPYYTQRDQMIRYYNEGAIPKPIQDMQATGFTPTYEGVSTYMAEFPPDSFDNTGNELILLKDVGAASTHDITVTSSLDPLTHEDYNLTLLPDRGTIIGPYPLDEYGALPTIEYDNTNLYISILKVEASA